VQELSFFCTAVAGTAVAGTAVALVSTAVAVAGTVALSVTVATGAGILGSDYHAHTC
jgi:hypothetical protein